MVLAGARAPSPSNSQPVRFVRFVSAAAKDSLRRAMEDGRERLLLSIEEKGASRRLRNWVNSYYRFSEFMFQAPVLFAVGSALSIPTVVDRLYRGGVVEAEADRGGQRNMDIAVGLALKGFILKGEELGLGSCILTAPLLFIEDPEKALGLEEIGIRCFIAAGYPDEEPACVERKGINEIYKEI